MRKVPWGLAPLLLSLAFWHCSDEHSLPQKFHENRIGTPSALEARFEADNVVLEWNIANSEDVFYYIVTVAEGALGAESKYTAPGDQETYTVEFAWTDSFYVFHVQAVDMTNFIGERSNADTVFIPQ